MRSAGPARVAGVVVVPAMAFFGGLGDLLATAAMGGWPSAEGITVAHGLSSWAPTEGTRAAGRVRGTPAGVLTAGQAFDAADFLAGLPVEVTLP